MQVVLPSSHPTRDKATDIQHHTVITHKNAHVLDLLLPWTIHSRMETGRVRKQAENGRAEVCMCSGTGKPAFKFECRGRISSKSPSKWASKNGGPLLVPKRLRLGRRQTRHRSRSAGERRLVAW